MGIDYKKLSSYSLCMGRRKQGTLLPIELKILQVVEELDSADRQAYGFALASALSAQEGKKLTAHGTLYKALARMTEAALLDSHWEDPEIAESEGRPRRRLYTITNSGRAALSLAAARVVSVPTAAPKVFRSVHP